MMDGCIIWNGSYDVKGYGRLYVDGKRKYAHRVAYCHHYSLNLQDIDGRVIRHKCDNPACVNPYHLISGTQLDNVCDRHQRNRDAKGEQNGYSKLTKEEVLAIRSSYRKRSKTHGITALAAEYGVHHSCIQRIINRKRWAHI